MAEIEGTTQVWWKIRDPGKVASVLWEQLRAMDSFRDTRLALVADLVAQLEREEWARLNSEESGGVGATEEFQKTVGNRGRDPATDGPLPSFNAQASLLWSLAALIFKDPPDIQVGSHEADFSMETAVRHNNAALDWALNNHRSSTALASSSRDGLYYGFGATFARIGEDGQVRYERVREHQLVWDPLEAQYGRVKSLHYRVRMDRDDILAMVRRWGKDAARGAEAMVKEMPAVREIAEDLDLAARRTPYQNALGGTDYHRGLMSDSLIVVYSWRCASSMDADDGRLVISVHTCAGTDRMESHKGAVLWDGVYKRTHPPIAWWTPFEPYEGLTSAGLGQLTRPFQAQLDRLWGSQDRVLNQFAQPKILVAETHADHVKAQLRESGVTVVKVPNALFGTTKLYEIVPGNPQSDQALAWIDRIYNTMMLILGANEGVTQGGSQIASGNVSGRALQVEDDRIIGRYADLEARWYQFRLDVAQRTLELFDDTAESDATFAVSVGRTMKRQRWSAIRIPDHGRFVFLEPRGVLARSPRGRIEQIQELADRGIVPPEAAADEISGYADVGQITRTAYSGRDLVKWQLAGLSEAGKKREEYAAFMPTPQTPTEIAVQLGLAHYQRAIVQGADEAVLDRLSDYMRRAKQLIAESQSPVAEPAPMEPAPVAEVSPMDAGVPPAALEIPQA